jgi:hypothetical protein
MTARLVLAYVALAVLALNGDMSRARSKHL